MGEHSNKQVFVGKIWENTNRRSVKKWDFQKWKNIPKMEEHPCKLYLCSFVHKYTFLKIQNIQLSENSELFDNSENEQCDLDGKAGDIKSPTYISRRIFQKFFQKIFLKIFF